MQEDIALISAYLKTTKDECVNFTMKRKMNSISCGPLWMNKRLHLLKRRANSGVAFAKPIVKLQYTGKCTRKKPKCSYPLIIVPMMKILHDVVFYISYYLLF